MKSMDSDRTPVGLFTFNRLLQAIAGIVVAGIFIAGGLSLGVQAPLPRPMPLTPDNSGERYLTHVTTDKPIYRTGEKVYVRGVFLRSVGHSPMSGPQDSIGSASFEIKGPKGDAVASGFASIIDSVVGFQWDIPSTQPGGEYTVRVSLPTGDPPAERKFDIRAYRAPRLKSQIVFVRDGYGPGDTVTATLHVERAEGGFPAGSKVSVTARVDGEETWKGETTVDGSGNAAANFKLPASINRGEGVVAMVIEDGGVVETATKTIPILLQTMDLAIYPEGGDLIAGLLNRVYIEGRTPAQKPADMAGVIVNAAGAKITTFRTEHEGRGRFSFVPAKGEKYSLRITEPAGIKTVFPLPAVRQSGVVMTATSDVTRRQREVVVRVAATAAGNYGIGLSQRGKEFSFKPITLNASQPLDVALSAPAPVDGVMVVTVYDARRTPMAERLVFRDPEHNLKVHIIPDRTDYVPGDKVTLRVTTTDDAGKPTGAVVGLTVTDSSVLEMIDKREQAAQLPVMVLLESDVRNLSDAHVYLDENNPKAPLAMDLLLGTQGWRRFATVDALKFLTEHRDAARRVLGMNAADAAVASSALRRGSILGLGALHGAVLDSTSALIPGVTVRAVNMSTGITVSAMTNETGVYAFNVIDPGTYQVSASLPGFQTKIIRDLQVAANSDVRQDLPLQIAAFNQRLEVFAKADMLVASAVAPAAFDEVKDGVRDLPRGLKNEVDVNNNAIRAQAVGEIRLKFADVDREMARKIARAPAPMQAWTVREYAHTLRPNWVEGSRADFAETVYWNAGIKTDASTGLATVSFNLSDSVTAFRVLADGFAQNGALGSGVRDIESVKPFSIEPKFPLQVTSGDVIQLPISIVNGMSRELRGANVTAKGPAGLKFTMFGAPSTLHSKERMRGFLQLDTSREFAGLANLTLDAAAGPYRDSVSRTLDIQPAGFPHESSSAGLLEKNGSRSFEFTLPHEIVPGSLSSTVIVYPTPLASMTDALQSLLREPSGCFEQTSSVSYPMVMAQQYFVTHTGIDPALIEKARNLLEVSYKKLTGFETRTKGYEWFGADPGHEALTAYGLMQFTDMSRVRAVDKDMIDRTRTWLLSRRDGKGGFDRNARALDSFGGAPAETTNGYIVWALIESGEKTADLAREIALVKGVAMSSQDSYIIALAANILNAAGDNTAARELMGKLVKAQQPDGNVKGAVTSITRSGGDALAIETTSLAVLAWLHEPAFAAEAQKGVKWIIESNKSGRFGSTQSTILALRSIVAYDNANARPKAPGRLILTVDGRSIGSPLAFTADTQGALAMPEFASQLGPGKHKLELKMEDGSSMPFSMNVRYSSTLPESSEQAPVGIQVMLKDRQVQEGNVTEATVSIVNKSNQPIPTPVAIVGIPGGLEVRHDQLKELVKSGKIDAYEVIGREVVLYWRFLKAKDRFDLPLSLIAAVPGSYTGPASRAYLYYSDEYKSWAPGINVSITPR